MSVLQCGIQNLTTDEMDFDILEIHTLQEWDLILMLLNCLLVVHVFI